jgi:hypothetical protein
VEAKPAADKCHPSVRVKPEGTLSPSVVECIRQAVERADVCAGGQGGTLREPFTFAL